MNIRNEEAEHSIEMQMPFIAKVMEGYATNAGPCFYGLLL